jgi:hypothetical protein
VSDWLQNGCIQNCSLLTPYPFTDAPAQMISSDARQILHKHSPGALVPYGWNERRDDADPSISFGAAKIRRRPLSNWRGSTDSCQKGANQPKRLGDPVRMLEERIKACQQHRSNPGEAHVTLV